MSHIRLAEIPFEKCSQTGVILRRHLLQTPVGWTFSNVVERDEAMAQPSLRGYLGGTRAPTRHYPRRMTAERFLEQRGFFRPGDLRFRAFYRGEGIWELFEEIDSAYRPVSVIVAAPKATLATLVDRYLASQCLDLVGPKTMQWEGVLDD